MRLALFAKPSKFSVIVPARADDAINNIDKKSDCDRNMKSVSSDYGLRAAEQMRLYTKSQAAAQKYFIVEYFLRKAGPSVMVFTLASVLANMARNRSIRSCEIFENGR